MADKYPAFSGRKYTNAPGWVPKSVWNRIFQKGKRAGRVEAGRRQAKQYIKRRGGTSRSWCRDCGYGSCVCN